MDDGADLLRAVYDYIGRFVAYPSVHAKVAHTLWIAHTHFMDAWDTTPRIAFLSPEPGSGKSRALEVTEPLVPRPVIAVNVSPAYLFRKISDDAGRPSILFDELDTVFGPKARDNEDVRGLLNAGYRKGAVAGRCVVRGKEVFTEELPAYCAVALAGLGNLPDTILTRSIIVKMQRRAPTEQVEPYRPRINSPEGEAIGQLLAAWAQAAADKVTYPTMPLGVEDRDADVWEALLAVADAAGAEWPELARKAAVALVKEAKSGSVSLGVQLLRDLRTIFGDADALASTTITERLNALDDAPWGDLRGKALDGRVLSRLLKPYGVTRRDIRFASGVTKGYRREDLHDPWTRYLLVETPTPTLTLAASR